MWSVNDLKRIYYKDYKSPFKRFSEEAWELANQDDVILHAGCGADESIGLRSKARLTIGIDFETWIKFNTDIDLGVIADLNRLPLPDNTVNYIVSRWVLEHLRNPEMFFQEAARVLTPGGRIIVLTPNRWHYAGAITSIVPHDKQKWFVKKILGGKPDDVFPTFYRSNTTRCLNLLAEDSGLVKERVEMLEGAPSLLGFSFITYLAGIA